MEGMKTISVVRCLFLCFVAVALSCGPGAGEAQAVPGIYIFGDSLVDVGNNNHLKLSTLKANFPHNGVDFAGKKATGRFCNGKNAADFMADKVGLPSSPPYLSLTSLSNGDKTSIYLTGVSFASGGAGIFDGSNNVFGETISMNKQVDDFSEVYATLVQHLGSDQTQKHLSRSLFGIVIGSNDLLGYFKPDSSVRSKTPPQAYVDQMLSTLKDQLKRIYNLGARKMAFVGAGAVGCCPAQRVQNKTEECNAETNYWSAKYNDGVKALLAAMKAEFKDMAFSFFDTYSVLLDLIQRPSAYGFAEVRAACCGLGNLRAKIPCLPIANYCPNRKDRVFWDLYHPTERAAQIFSDMLFDGSTQFVQPINVKQLIAL